MTEKLFANAVASFQAGRLDHAERDFKKILRENPKHAGALNLLGILLTHLKKYDDAEKILRSALSASGNSDATHYNYGIVLKALNRPVEALARFTEALSLNPAVSDTWNNRGTVYVDLKRFNEALSDFHKAVTLNPDSVAAYCNMGKSYAQLTRDDEALAAYDKALSLKPDLIEALLGRGNIFTKFNRYDEAFGAYDKALSFRPDLAESWLGRGNLFVKLNRYDEAFGAYDRALSIRPDLAEAWLGRGNLLTKLDRYDEAIAAYDKALSFKPDLAEVWYGRGNLFAKLKRYEDAFKAYDRSFSANPELDFVEAARLNAKSYLCDWNKFDSECRHLMSSLEAGKIATPFSILAVISSPVQQLKFTSSFFENEFGHYNIQEWNGEKYKHDRIRVGYVSTDFHHHATSILMAGMFESHNKSKFDLSAISIGADDKSSMRGRLEKSFDRFIDVQTFSDEAIAAKIRELEIDILIDLKGFTQDARPGVFARRPAPIQVNYLGYPGTMGADCIDYLIADRTLIPDPAQQYYTEKIVYMPDTYQVNDASRPVSTKAFSRSEFNLPESGFVFCCFNNNYKIMPNQFDCWMRILTKVKGSVLWLLEDNAGAAANLKKEAGARGVDPERLIFAKRMDLPDHLARHRLADLFLDTLPCNAHTTASDALWAGLPILTQIGDTFAGRVAASLLNALAMPELITTSQRAYEELAIELATHGDRLAGIKRKLGENRLTAALFDTKRFTICIEAAYTMMHERHLAGLPPEHFYVAKDSGQDAARGFLLASP